MNYKKVNSSVEPKLDKLPFTFEQLDMVLENSKPFILCYVILVGLFLGLLVLCAIGSLLCIRHL